MPILYNCHTDGDQYRITKFDSIGEPQSSYLCTEEECECPAGVRQTCRHRQMLRLFLQKDAVNTHWCYNYDLKYWVKDEPAIEMLAEAAEIAFTIPQRVTVLSLDDPETVHNTIADAVGEPRIRRRV